MAKLKFKNQLAKGKNKWFYRCARGHDVLLSAQSRPGILARKRAHEAEHAQPETYAPMWIGKAFGDYIARIERLEQEGRRSPETVLHYEKCARPLLQFFGDEESCLTVAQERHRIETYIQWRLASGRTRGARCLKELKALSTVLEWHGFRPRWKSRHFIDDIRPVANERKKRTMQDVRDLLGALDPESVEYAFVLTKALTGLRNVELYELRVSSLRIHEGTLQLVRRSKRKTFDDVVPIPSRLVSLLGRWAEGRTPDAPLLHLQGRKLGQSSLRKRLLHQTSTSVTSLGWIRHVVISTVIEKADVYTAQRGVGHRSVTTTEGYNIGDELDRQRKHMEVLAAELAED